MLSLVGLIGKRSHIGFGASNRRCIVSI
jgi:hypothetical protein